MNFYFFFRNQTIYRQSFYQNDYNNHTTSKLYTHEKWPRSKPTKPRRTRTFPVVIRFTSVRAVIGRSLLPVAKARLRLITGVNVINVTGLSAQIALCLPIGKSLFVTAAWRRTDSRRTRVYLRKRTERKNWESVEVEVDQLRRSTYRYVLTKKDYY